MNVNVLKKNNLHVLSGKWISYFENIKITIDLRNTNKCTIELVDLKTVKKEKFNGNCEIDTTKIPNSFIVNNIAEIDNTLYSIFRLINNKKIQMSKFSSNWKLRPVAFTKKHTLTFKKDKF